MREAVARIVGLLDGRSDDLMTVLLDGMYVDFSDTRDGTFVATDAEVSGGYFEASAAYPAAL